MRLTLQQKIGLTAWLIAISWAVLIVGLRQSGLRINETPSLPVGLWRATKLETPIQRGMIVSFCPPASEIFKLAKKRGYLSRGHCPSSLEPLLKPVAAIAGDSVTINDDGVAVNGMHLPRSRPLQRDHSGRTMIAMAPGSYRVEEGQVWLVSSFDERSFDSRYFGPVSVTDLIEKVDFFWVYSIIGLIDVQSVVQMHSFSHASLLIDGCMIPKRVREYNNKKTLLQIVLLLNNRWRGDFACPHFS